MISHRHRAEQSRLWLRRFKSEAPATRAEHFAAAAETALRKAVKFRDESLRRFVPFDRRCDRAIMREFALEYRRYLARSQEPAAHPITYHP